MIRKAIITAAGKGTRQYPATNAVQKEMFPLVDRHGITKPTIQIIVEEVLAAGITDIAIIVQPGEEKQFQAHFQGLSVSGKQAFAGKSWGLEQSDRLDAMRKAISYVHQSEQHGFGHAVYCAREWANGEPVLLMLGDHVYISETDLSCTMQIIAKYNQFQTSIFAVQRTPIDQLHLFGTVAGTLHPIHQRSYNLHRIIEKPTSEIARTELLTQNLPPDIFLTIFGQYILTPSIFDILADHIAQNKRDKGEIQLTNALAELIHSEDTMGYETQGQRLDMGTPAGYIQTQIALALESPYRSTVLEQIASSRHT